MGWESREWAQWSEEQRDAYLDGRAPRSRVTGAQLVERLDSPYSSGISVRVKVWGGLAVITALFVVVLAILMMSAPTYTAVGAWRPTVLYGWQNVPPIGAAYIDPSRIGTTMDGRPVLCTTREPDRQGRWTCTEYSYVNEGQRVVVMPPTSQLHSVACNTRPDIACPGTTI
jgi:hypothetical protein